MTCVSTFQQGRAVFAALISSAQQVWKTFDFSLMLICPKNIVLLVFSLYIPRVLGKPDFELTLAGHAIHVGP